MKVKLSNGEIVEMTQITKTDCGKNLSVGFVPLTTEQLESANFQELLESNLTLLSRFDWVTIRIEGTELYADVQPIATSKNPKPEQFFRQHIMAIANK